MRRQSRRKSRSRRNSRRKKRKSKSRRSRKTRGSRRRRSRRKSIVSALVATGLAAAAVASLYLALHGRPEKLTEEKNIRAPCPHSDNTQLKKLKMGTPFRIRVISRKNLGVSTKRLGDAVQHHYLEFQGENCSSTLGIELDKETGNIQVLFPDFLISEFSRKFREKYKDMTFEEKKQKMLEYRLANYKLNPKKKGFYVDWSKSYFGGKTVFQGKLNADHVSLLKKISDKSTYSIWTRDFSFVSKLKFGYLTCMNHYNCKSFAHMFATQPKKLEKALFP